MGDNIQTNENEIINLAEKYGLKVSFLDMNGIYVKSLVDEWFVEVIDDSNIKLYHFNTRNNLKGKHQKHFQRKYRDFEFMFRSIKQHDKWKLSNNPYDRLNTLLDKNNRINYVKFS